MFHLFARPFLIIAQLSYLDYTVLLYGILHRTTVLDMEIQSIDRGRRPQHVQNVACSAQSIMLIRPMQPAAHNYYMLACTAYTDGCMASALGPLDVRPDFHVHDSTSYCCTMLSFHAIVCFKKIHNQVWVLKSMKIREIWTTKYCISRNIRLEFNFVFFVQGAFGLN